MITKTYEKTKNNTNHVKNNEKHVKKKPMQQIKIKTKTYEQTNKNI